MVRHSLIRYCLTAALLLGAAGAQANTECTPAGQKVTGLVKDKAATYSESGKVVGAVEKSAVAQESAVLACNEDLGLVKIKLAGSEVWLDRAAVNIAYTQAAKIQKKPCIRVAQNKKDDQRTLGVAGAGSEHCEPGTSGE